VDAYRQAREADPLSAFGGIVALNREVDDATGKALAETFLEAVIAPSFSPAAKEALASKKNLRLLEAGAKLASKDAHARAQLDARSISGGVLVMDRDALEPSTEWKVVTKRAPTADELKAMKFGWRVCKHVKSNAIVYAKDSATVGIGAGQPSRVDSARIGAWKSEAAAKAAGLDTPLTRGSVVASDAFFPFADGLEEAIAAGATAVIQPGGSVRDKEVIAAADAAGVAMVFTGMRHFRH
jgi:phosphoribosylaminoimidazolecarboxamide formyltransferase/IMP cyclohydrolase